MATKSARVDRTWMLWLGLVVVVAIGAFVVSRSPFMRPVDWAVRLPALVGYLAVFAAAVTSAYLRQMVRWFGRPFLTVHHYLAIAGLVLLTLHPLAAALRAQSASLFVPDLSSALEFVRWGGRPAWYLLLAAAVAAVYRSRLGRRWRWLHGLTYVAFWLGTAHAIMLGADVQAPVPRVLAVLLVLIMLVVLVMKRREASARRAGKAGPRRVTTS